MQLGRKNRDDDLLDTIKAEEGIPDQPLAALSQLSIGGQQGASPTANVSQSTYPQSAPQSVKEG